MNVKKVGNAGKRSNRLNRMGIKMFMDLETLKRNLKTLLCLMECLWQLEKLY
jgi:hypothetical protein